MQLSTPLDQRGKQSNQTVGGLRKRAFTCYREAAEFGQLVEGGDVEVGSTSRAIVTENGELWQKKRQNQKGLDKNCA